MNEKKFTEVFNKYNRLVRKMVISRSGNDMLAEEICQQVFLQYFEQMNNISEELIQPWLLLTTRNMVYDYHEKDASPQRYTQHQWNRRFHGDP